MIGIDASAKPDETRAQVAKMHATPRNSSASVRELREEEIIVLDGWAGEHYGIPVASDT